MSRIISYHFTLIPENLQAILVLNMDINPTIAPYEAEFINTLWKTFWITHSV